MSHQDKLKALREELTYERFLEMKQHWLRSMRNEWLITGHITEDEALSLVAEAESCIKFE